MSNLFERLNLEEVGKKISDTLTETAGTVGKKTEEIVSVQKLKSQIRTLQRSNEREYMDIGKMIYEKFQSGGEISGEYAAICEEIQKREQEIEDAMKQIAEIKGIGVCSNCQTALDKGMAFCPTCGQKVEKQPYDVDAEDVEEVDSELEDDFEPEDVATEEFVAKEAAEEAAELEEIVEEAEAAAEAEETAEEAEASEKDGE